MNFTGSGTKTITGTAAGVANDCAKWDANGNVIDAGSPCGTGSGSGIAGPSSTTTGNVPQFGNTTGSALSTGLGVVTAVGSPGADTNLPTEKSVRTAIASAVASVQPVSLAFIRPMAVLFTPHTLVASDIPALPYQATLSFTGNGTKTISSTAAGVSNNCAKWDANGNVIDAGAPCGSGSGSSITTPSQPPSATSPNLAMSRVTRFRWDSALSLRLVFRVRKPISQQRNRFARRSLRRGLGDRRPIRILFGKLAVPSLPIPLVASDIPALPYQATLSFTGTGTKTISSTAAGVSNNCAKWDANGNVIDAGAPCGTGSGSSITTPSTTTIGNVPQFGNGSW